MISFPQKSGEFFANRNFRFHIVGQNILLAACHKALTDRMETSIEKLYEYMTLMGKLKVNSASTFINAIHQ